MKYLETFCGHHTALNTSYSVVERKSKRLPLEIKNTQNNKNRRLLGFIKSFQIQQCRLRDCIHPLALKY